MSDPPRPPFPPPVAGRTPVASRTPTLIAAVLCFAAAAGAAVYSPETALWSGAAVKVGLLLGALWLALPTRTRPAAWGGWDWKTGGLVFGGLLLSARAPQLGLPVLAGVAAWRFWVWLKTPPAAGETASVPQ